MPGAPCQLSVESNQFILTSDFQISPKFLLWSLLTPNNKEKGFLIVPPSLRAAKSPHPCSMSYILFIRKGKGNGHIHS